MPKDEREQTGRRYEVTITLNAERELSRHQLERLHELAGQAVSKWMTEFSAGTGQTVIEEQHQPAELSRQLRPGTSQR